MSAASRKLIRRVIKATEPMKCNACGSKRFRTVKGKGIFCTSCGSELYDEP